MSEQHNCQPPREDRSKDKPLTWTCPDCGNVWKIRATGEAYRFSPSGGGDPITPAKWVRVDTESQA